MSFEDRLLSGPDDGTQENTPLIVTTEQPYRRIRTTAFIVIQILLTVSRCEPLLEYQCRCSRLFSKRPSCSIHTCVTIEKSLQYVGIILRTTLRCMFMLVCILSALLLIGEHERISLIEPKHCYFSLYHYQQDLSRRDGYLDFYRRTRLLRPLLVISAGKPASDRLR
jgi:hypothetical protein